MDPFDVLELCKQASLGLVAFDFVRHVPITAATYEAAWRRDPARVRRALDEVLCGVRADDGLDLLMQSGALHALVPELVAIRDLGDDPVSSMHKDVWRHTTQVVMGVPAAVELRWSALMHDVGKAQTRRVEGNRVTFHNHDVVGARIVERIDRRLGLFRDDPALFNTVHQLVLNHLRPASYGKDWTDSGVRRLVADLGGLQGFERLMQLSRADLTTKNPRKRDHARRKGDELEARVLAVVAQDNRPRLPKFTMRLIIERRVLPVGPWLNVTREGLEAMLADGSLPLGKDAEWYANEGLTLYLERKCAVKASTDAG